MPPSPPPPLLLFFLISLLTATSASTAHAQQSRRLLQSSLPLPPPPPPPPHHRHHHTPRSPPPPQPTPTHPKPRPPNPPPAVSPPPTSAPPPTQTPTPIPIPPPPPPAPRFTSTSTTPNPTPDNAYPFTNYPFFPTASPPPPAADQQQPPTDGSRTFPANISNLVAPNATDGPSGSSPRRFPVLQAVLLAFISLCLLLLSALLSIHLFRRLRRPDSDHHAAPSASSSSAARREDLDDDEDGDEEGRSLKPPPMPTSSTNPSTEFLYLGTLASSATPPTSGTATHQRPGSPELRPLPPLPRVGPPSGEFFAAAAANRASLSSSSLSPSSPSASSPTLGSSPAHVVHAVRPPSIPQPRGRAPNPNPSPPKRRPPPPHNQSWNPFIPVPPPAQAAPSDDDDGGESYTTEMRKSRPLHSDKLKPVSLHMKDEMIQMYLNNSAAAAAREVCLLGAARCHGIGMVLGALGVSQEQLRDALLEGNAHSLGVEALRMLTQLVLTNEEELKLRYFKDDPPAKLCPVDAFLKTILDVPFAFKRVDAMLYVSNFYLEVNQLRMSYATLEAACQELRGSRLFHRVLGAVLNFGNLMSINTGSPNSHALEPNTLLKIVDVKGADGKAALLQFVVQEIMKPEGHNNLNPSHSWSAASKTNASANTLPYDVDCRKHGLQVVSRLATELTSTKKAASIDITSLSRTVSELGVGLGKIHDVLRLNSMAAPSVVENARRFHGAMGAFLRQAEEEVVRLQGQESVCLSSVREIAEYFHGGESPSSDETRSFRVFAGVREFVAMLDMICRQAGEVGGDRVGSTTVNWMAAAPVAMTATP